MSCINSSTCTDSITTTTEPKPKMKRKQPKKKKTVKQTETHTNDSSSSQMIVSELLIKNLALLDTILQFLTKATGETVVDIDLIQKTLPTSSSPDDATNKLQVLSDIPELICRGILSYESNDDTIPPIPNKDNGVLNLKVGYAPPCTSGKVYITTLQQNLMDGTKLLISNTSLHGNSKTAAKKRLVALKRSLKALPHRIIHMEEDSEESVSMDWIKRKIVSSSEAVFVCNGVEDECMTQKQARKKIAGAKEESKETEEDNDIQSNVLPSFFGTSLQILPNQASYAGCQPGRNAQYTTLPTSLQEEIPQALLQAFSLVDSDTIDSSIKSKLYSHQVQAVESVLLHNQNTFICTSTGSGKSLCFLLPVLTKAMLHPDESTSLLIFPTKALAQDQYQKLQSFLQKQSYILGQNIRPGVIDGDTTHTTRLDIVSTCNIIFTNPDTIHAAMLPKWKTLYRRILSSLQYIVLDEAHVYNGVFGNHVAFVLKRLYRLSHVLNPKRVPTLIACSATIDNPALHFSNFCWNGGRDVRIIAEEEDGSPSIPKHYFVWNPPLLNVDGVTPLPLVVPKMTNSCMYRGKHFKRRKTRLRQTQQAPSSQSNMDLYRQRRHAADETAYLLCTAIQNQTRVIAFCKSRSLVEWVYHKSYHILNDNPSTSHLTSQLESYRGGYSKQLRRDVEERFFTHQLLGIVTTNALELGIDIGGIDVTLHCGFPGSYASLLQQSGRAGRVSAEADAGSSTSSVSIVICFNSPADQYLWSNPSKLLSRPIKKSIEQEDNNGSNHNPIINTTASIAQGHLLCAAAEYPLMKQSHSICELCHDGYKDCAFVSDDCLFFGRDEYAYYNDTVDCLVQKKYLRKKENNCCNSSDVIECYITHPFLENPWSNLSLRSIEPIHYSLVDTTHPLQHGGTHKCLDKEAILDTIPYSRIFYHAFPGAIIMHRGKSYIVSGINPPPTCVVGRYNGDLCAFLKPIKNINYYTRALRAIKITVVKRLECMDIDPTIICKGVSSKDVDSTTVNLSNHDTKCLLNDSPVKKESDFAIICSDDQKVMNNLDTVAMASVTTNQISTIATNAEKNISTNFSRSIGGNGIVNIKHAVFGYVKLSSITHAEISRNEITLPPMEYDTHALWLDTEASMLSSTLLDYNAGVHALSHAILAVVPLFVSCAISDIDCDHSLQNSTRILVYDVTAGGSGACAQIWNCMFQHNNGDGIFKAALDLLRNCPSCDNSQSGDDRGQQHEYYDSGCPACLHSCPCTNSNTGLSRKAARVIGEHIYNRWMLAFSNDAVLVDSNNRSDSTNASFDLPSPSNTNKRINHLQNSHDHSQIVVGRPSWPCFDQNNDVDSDDYFCTKSNSQSRGENKGIQGAGFMVDKNI